MTATARLAATPVQKAMYARATADSALAGKVFDQIPEPKAYPYITIGEVIETEDNAHGEFGRDLLVSFHIWSSYRGFAEGNALADRLVQLFDHQPLEVDGHRVVSVRFESAATVRDPDPDIRHVPVEFRVITEQEE